jgi:WD40 repeat protein
MHGERLISGCGDGRIMVWSTDTWTCERTLEDHKGAVNCLLIHGDKLISGSDDGTARVWGS